MNIFYRYIWFHPWSSPHNLLRRTLRWTFGTFAAFCLLVILFDYFTTLGELRRTEVERTTCQAQRQTVADKFNALYKDKLIRRIMCAQ